jgi:cAMP-specific phosphodiesterase 4
MQIQNKQKIGSRRISVFSDEKNKKPLLFLVKNTMPVIVATESLNSIDNNSQETHRDYSFLDEMSILYKNNNQHINDKYADMINELNRVADLNFNVFNLSKYSNNLELCVLMNHLMKLHNFNETINVNSLHYKNYFFQINTNYRKNTFHNSIHASDVVQTLYFIIKTCNVDLICNLTDLDIFSCYFAAAIHDLDHPGNNNNYEIQVGSKLALSYNDKAVLENYHLYKAFRLLKMDNCDVFEGFSTLNYNTARATIISMVLSTDMANHFSDLALIKKRVKTEDFNPQTIDKQPLLNQLIHASDISNPTKPIDLYKEWVSRLFIEFYNQGDKEREKGLNISFMCDRYNTNISSAQVDFIDNIVFPLYDTLSLAFPNLKMINNIILNNKEEFKKLKDSNHKFV